MEESEKSFEEFASTVEVITVDLKSLLSVFDSAYFNCLPLQHTEVQQSEDLSKAIVPIPSCDTSIINSFVNSLYAAAPSVSVESTAAAPTANVAIADTQIVGIMIIVFKQGTAKRKLIRKAVKVALDNLKAQSPVLLLSSHARKIQKYAPDLSRCIASLIASSDDRVFQRECASLLGLEAKDVGNELLELRIEEKLVEVISMNDVKKDRDLAPSLFEREPFRDEDCPEEHGDNEDF
ncbi:hypothetical protein KSP40_PGU002530 [Platanthera guangdongensis]|uniref:Uncharacterized protein n=1 Tax=Platanthera guangdongensis TaxID=2320717 RepID=A0ABR2LHH3_9ASPA